MGAPQRLKAVLVDRGPKGNSMCKGPEEWGGTRGGAGAAAGEAGRASQEVSVGLQSPVYAMGDLGATGRLLLFIFLTSLDLKTKTSKRVIY